MNLTLELRFGVGGNEQEFLGDGWGDAEAGGRWAVGEVSELVFPNSGSQTDRIIELGLFPFIQPPQVLTQPLSLFVGDVLLGEVELNRPELLGWRIPAGCPSGPGPLIVRLVHPKPRRPSDFGGGDDRSLSIAITAVRLWHSPAQTPSKPETSLGEGEPTPVPTHIAARDLVCEFESLGDNCEFGFVQRKCEQEPVGLLRFGYIHLSALIRGIRCNFAGIADPGYIDIEIEETEYVIQEKAYGIRYHTFIHPDHADANTLLRQQQARTKFLARKLMDDFDEAAKIFVLRRNIPLNLEEVLPLYCTIRSKGENTLLWVVPADSGNPPCTVRRIMPGLLQGFISTLASPEDVSKLILDDWLKICSAARHLAREALHLESYTLKGKTSDDLVMSLDLGNGGNADGYLGIGWPGSENGFRWMVDNVSELWLEHPGHGFDYTIDADVVPFVRDLDLPQQRLSVEVRGTEIASEILVGPSRLRWRIPSYLLDAPGPVRISFRHPDARQPSDFGDSSDGRTLAIAVRSLRLIRLRPEPDDRADTQRRFMSTKKQADSVVFVGNCQMEVLARLYTATRPPDDRTQVAYIASYNDATDEQRQAISESDILVQQVLDFVPAVGELKSRGRMIPVPHFTAAFLWPFTGQAHPLNRPEPVLDASGPYPSELGDSFLNRMILREMSPDNAVREYLATDVAALKRIDRLGEIVFEKQRTRDRACGFLCADYIEANFRSRYLFRTPNHPDDQAARWFACEVLGRIEDDDLTARIDAVDMPLFPATQVPIHPSVASHFSLAYVRGEDRYHYYNEGRFTFSEWADRYMRYEWNQDLAYALHELHVGNVEVGLRQLRLAVASAPRAAGARVILADGLERRGQYDEAAKFAHEAWLIEPHNERFRQRSLELQHQRELQAGSRPLGEHTRAA